MYIALKFKISNMGILEFVEGESRILLVQLIEIDIQLICKLSQSPNLNRSMEKINPLTLNTSDVCHKSTYC